MAHAGETGAHALLAEQHRHQAKPHRRGQRQIEPVARLDRQRRVRVDHHGEQRQEEQRGLGVQAIGHEARGERATGRAFAGFLVQVFGRRLRRLRAQGLEADVQQVGSRQPFKRVEQHDRLRNDQADTQQRITHMQENRAADTQRRPRAGATTMGHRLTHHHGKVRAGAGDGQQVNQGNGQKLCPIHAGSSKGRSIKVRSRCPQSLWERALLAMRECQSQNSCLTHHFRRQAGLAPKGVSVLSDDA
ncbi:hypothetical protein D3C84_779800 [compost metagenome]